MTSSPATDWSVAFIRELIAGGLEHVVVSPGARSQALALAAVAWERVPGSPLSVHVVIDERSAAFRALGLALESKQPVVCVSTSGSAPTHYSPAVREALHQGVPLILVSADRPEELQGVGANQTTNQRNLFGEAVPCIMVPAPTAKDATRGKDIAKEALAIAAQNTPVQVNVAFREPLSSASSLTATDLPERAARTMPRAEPSTLVLGCEPGTLVVAGSGAGPRAEAWAVELGAPLIAEVTSGARFGPHLVPAYREVLSQSELPTSITRIITVGRPTLSRELQGLLSRDDVVHIALTGDYLEVTNPSRSAQIVDDLAIDPPASPQQRSEWVKPWVVAGREVHDRLLFAITPEPPNLAALESNDQAVRSAFASAEMQVLRQPITRPSLALAVWEATWPHDRLVLGASRMIREVDRIAPGKNITVRANRGLSGIDGTIATARGIAQAHAAAGGSGVTRVLLGDLAFLHDVGSLLVEPGAPDHSRVHLIVAHDGGGSIFDLLEAPEGVPAEDRDRVMFTPHTVDLHSVAAAYGWEYVRAQNRGDLHEAMSRGDQRLIVDVTLTRE
jgi:2-succinyl-5-enolpyruvyl-6-hydroxy-3-cyclohexene-1-carboxylate synthase